jgi:hypothetical protein
MGDDNIYKNVNGAHHAAKSNARQAHFSPASFREEAAEILKSKSSIHTNTHSHAAAECR